MKQMGVGYKKANFGGRGVACGRSGQGCNASSPPQSKYFQWKPCWNWAEKGGGSISPLTTPPPCHAPTSKDNFLVPYIHLLYLCHHILPLVNKLLWNLHWKMSVNVKSLERNLIGIPISEWINALFIIVSHLSWHCQPKSGFRTPKYLPGCLKYCCMHICMYIFDPVCIFMISGKCM